jgi:hypothetical protein
MRRLFEDIEQGPRAVNTVALCLVCSLGDSSAFQPLDGALRCRRSVFFPQSMTIKKKMFGSLRGQEPSTNR